MFCRFRLFVLARCCVLFLSPKLSAAPVLSATLDDNITNRVLRGTTVTNTLVITNSGDTNATSVLLTIPTPANATDVAGSIRITPVAVDDSYTALGNTVMTVAAGAGVLTNDFDPDGNIVVKTNSVVSTGGTASPVGALVINTDGSFTYTPGLGATGTDVFKYTITDNQGQDSLTPGFVTFTMTLRVWYVQNASINGDGRSSTPFNNLTSVSTAANTNTDIIYVFSDIGANAKLNGNLVLDDGQQLLGQGVALNVGGLPVFSAGTAPTLNNTGGNIITLGQDNLVTGLVLGNRAAASAAITGTSFGTLTVSNLTINGTGGVMSLSTGTIHGTIDALSTTSASLGVSLTTVSGTFTINNAAISGVTGTDFLVNGGSANITYNGTITHSLSGTCISVQSKTRGTLTFNGNITSSTSSSGIILKNNSGSTANFLGALTLNTGTNNAFIATGGGTVNANNAANTITTTSGIAVDIKTPSSIGASGVTFKSISANTSGNAIMLSGTTNNFTVTGDGASTNGQLNRNGSGGTLSGTTGHSILLTGARNVTLQQMNIQNPAANFDAISSSGGGDITVSAVLFQNLSRHGWNITNINGVNIVNGCRFFTWNTAQANAVQFINTDVNFTSFNISNSVFSTSATGAAGANLNAFGTSSGTFNVFSNEFTLIDQNAAQINNNGSGAIRAIVQKNNFHDADATSGDGNNTLYLTCDGNGQLNFTVGGPNASDGNTFKNLARLTTLAGVLQVDCATVNQTNSQLNGTIQNNIITNIAGIVNGRRGIDIQIEANGGTQGGHLVKIANNTINNVSKQGIHVSTSTLNGGKSLNNHFTVQNNVVGTVANPVGSGGGDSGSGIEITADGSTSGVGNNQSSSTYLFGTNSVVNIASASDPLADTFEIKNRGRALAGNSSILNVTFLGNTFQNLDAANEVFEIRNVTDASNFVNLDLNSGNTSPNTATGGNGTGFKLTNDSLAAANFTVENMGASTPSAFLGSKNSGTITAAGSFSSNAGVPMPTAPSF